MNLTTLKGSINTVVQCVGNITTEIRLKGNIETIITLKGSVSQFLTSNTLRAISFIKCKVTGLLKIIRNLKTNTLAKVNILPSLRLIRYSKTIATYKTRLIARLNVSKRMNSIVKPKFVIGKNSNLGTLDAIKLEDLDNLTLETMEFLEGVLLNIKKVVKNIINSYIVINATMGLIRYVKLEVYDPNQLDNMDTMTLEDLDRAII